MKRVLKSLLIVCAVAGVACSGNEKKQAVEEVKEVSKVSVATATRRNITQSVSFTGTVEAQVVNNIASQQPLRITKILVDVGDRVKAGQTLVTLDNSSLVQASAQLENAKKEFERAKELYEFGGASKSEYDGRKLSYEVAKSAYNNLVENTTLVSPVSGVVTARNFDVGDMASGYPVLVVEQIRPVKIMINVSESLFSKVKRGMKVYVTLDAYGDEQFEGRIARIYPTINNTTRTFQVEVSIPNNDERVRPGMFARVNLPYATVNRVIISDRAVNKLMGSGDRYVFIYNPADSTVRYSKVELGQRLDYEYEVLSGVEDGEQVVVLGQLGITSGEKVELNK
ncbi:MAG: efflux RND transporter periplasmic adaptor subunit [Alistipes sp.]|jgi:RND family efflux transporter MFP subunit|nr:efflux RND transporter periplasmic adaptor subunit [Alistipes sp.]